MVRQVVWARAALADLEEIHDYIAQDSPDNASRFCQRLVEKASSLSKASERGGRVPEHPELRQVVVGSNYRLLYRVEESIAGIVAVIHSRRDLAAFLQRRTWSLSPPSEE